MRNVIVKSLFILAVGFMSISADAAWKCQMTNGKGQNWNGMGPTRAAAAANAMTFCSKNSSYAKNCVVRWCRSGY